MKRETFSGWELIEHDPLLRRELSSIEQHPAGDELVNSLIEFFDRIDVERQVEIQTSISTLTIFAFSSLRTG